MSSIECVCSHITLGLEHNEPGVRVLKTINPERLRKPYEHANVEMLDPVVAHFIMNDIDEQTLIHLLLTRTHHGKNVLTLSWPGVTYEGPVAVRSWKDAPRFQQYIDAGDRYDKRDLANREMARQSIMEHVAGFSQALACHQARISGKELVSITADQAAEIYKAILCAIPLY